MSSVPDVRHRYIRGLQHSAVRLAVHAHDSMAFTHTCRAAVMLALEDEAVRNAEDAQRLVRGVGNTIRGRLEEVERDRSFSDDPPRQGRYSSAAAAILVALRQWEADGRDGASSPQQHCPQKYLLERARALLDSRSPAFLSEEQIADGAKCAMWQHKVTLESIRYIKRHSAQKQCAAVEDSSQHTWELLPAGAERAARLEAEGEARMPGAVREHCPSAPLLMLVDEREGGGLRRDKFHLLCAHLARARSPFATCRLPSGLGDYLFVCQGADGARRALPLLIERKSMVDVGASLRDGRWTSQQAAMKRTAREMSSGSARAAAPAVRLVYIVEGASPPPAYRCGCGSCTGQGVGGCANQYASVDDVLGAVDALPAAGFEVVHTASLAATCNWLAAEAERQKAALSSGAAAPVDGFALPPSIRWRAGAGEGAAGPTGPSPAAAAHPSTGGASAQARLDGLPGWAARATKPGTAAAATAAAAAGTPSASASPQQPMPAPKKRGRQPTPIMPFEELESGLRAFIAQHSAELEGSMPSGRQLKAGGRADLERAVGKHGGVKAVCAKLRLAKEGAYFPRERSCNFAILVVMHRRWVEAERQLARLHGTRPTLPEVRKAAAAPKEKLMQLANDGRLCTEDLFARTGGFAGQAGLYDGFASVQKMLVAPDPPRESWVQPFSGRKAGKGAERVYALTKEFGLERAARLHAHAEHHGWCDCGLVRPRPLGLLAYDGPGYDVDGAAANDGAPPAPAPLPAPGAPPPAAPPAPPPRAPPPPAPPPLPQPARVEGGAAGPRAEAEARARKRPARPAPETQGARAPAPRAPSPQHVISLTDEEEDEDEGGDEGGGGEEGGGGTAMPGARPAQMPRTGASPASSGVGVGAAAAEPAARATPPPRTPSPGLPRLRTPWRHLSHRTPGEVQIEWTPFYPPSPDAAGSDDDGSDGVMYEVQWRTAPAGTVADASDGTGWGEWTSSEGSRRILTLRCRKTELPQGDLVAFRVRALCRATGRALTQFSDPTVRHTVPGARAGGLPDSPAADPPEPEAPGPAQPSAPQAAGPGRDAGARPAGPAPAAQPEPRDAGRASEHEAGRSGHRNGLAERVVVGGRRGDQARLHDDHDDDVIDLTQ